MREIVIDGVKYIPEVNINTDYVIIRGRSSGVFAGNLKEKTPQGSVILINCRRLWAWYGAASISQLAMEGVKKPKDCKFPIEMIEVEILDPIEIVKCTDKAKESIKNVPVWSA